jgi:hypothetical protein
MTTKIQTLSEATAQVAEWKKEQKMNKIVQSNLENARLLASEMSEDGTVVSTASLLDWMALCELRLVEDRDGVSSQGYIEVIKESLLG